MVAVSQSGETTDTLAAVREAKARGAHVVAIANVIGSAIPRASDASFYTHAGPEIGVASTKAFVAMLAASLLLLGIRLGVQPQLDLRPPLAPILFPSLTRGADAEIEREHPAGIRRHAPDARTLPRSVPIDRRGERS